MSSKEELIYKDLENARVDNKIKTLPSQMILGNKEVSMPILIKELKKLDSKYDAALIGFVLRKMGAYSFDEVMKIALSKNQEISRRGNWTAAGYGKTAFDKVLENLNHPSPRIRENMIYAIQCLKEGDNKRKAIPRLIDALEDEVQNVRKRAIYALQKFEKSEILQPLLEARNTGSKRLRRTTLIALLDMFPEDLSENDKKLVQRYDRVMALNDKPKPFSENSWIVIPKTDLDTILEFCELYEPEIASFSKGLDAVNCDFWYMKSDIEKPTKTRVFITPVIEDKWIFLVGGSYGITKSSQVEVNQIVNNLSRKLGEAYCFTSQMRMGWYSWTISKNGEIIRQYMGEGGVIDFGELTEPEKSIRAKLKAEEIDEEFFFDWLPKISNYYCLHPEQISEQTKISGFGFLAKTTYGLQNGIPKRALAYWKDRI